MMKVQTAWTIALALFSSSLGACGFRPTSSRAVRMRPATKTTTTQAFRGAPTSTGWDSFERLGTPMTNIPSGEEQRKLRRTVYSHDDWKKHRNQDRFLYYLAAVFKSGVYKNLQGEVFLTTAIATIVCAYNAIVGGYTDFAGVNHAAIISTTFLPKIGLPLAAFTLTSPALGLLLGTSSVVRRLPLQVAWVVLFTDLFLIFMYAFPLFHTVFRTNTSYQRWDEARKNWGMNINHTRNLNRMANAYYDSTGISPEQRANDLNHVALCTWCFVRAMKRHLSPEEEDERAFQQEAYEKLPNQQAEMLIAAAHRPNRALQDLSYAVDDLPMHFLRKNEIHRALTIFEDNLGSSERILTSPVPLFYSRHLARFLAAWLLLLPFGIYEPFGNSWNHIAMIPATTVISIMLFGIEEIGTQLEEPFTVLPMQAFCDKIYNWCFEIATWRPGDNGRAPRPVRPEHAYFTEGATVRPYPPPPPPPLPQQQQQPQYAAPPQQQQQVAYPQQQPVYAQGPPPPQQQQQPPPQQQQQPAYNQAPPQQQQGPQSMAEFLKSQGQGGGN